MTQGRTKRSTEKSLTVNGLEKTYPQWRKKSTRAVDGISFSVDEGEIVGFLGPNGAGKTTTIKCICGLVEPTKGEINIFGIDAVNDTRKAVSNTSAVLEGNRNIYWRLTTRENLEFFARLHGRRLKEAEHEIKSLLKRFDLQEKEDVPARKLSRGMQQKLALSCALIRGTDFLLLDEPTLGLDVKTSKEMREFVKRLTSDMGKTILLSSHDMNVVEDVCERVIIMNEGKILANDSVNNLKDVFNVHLYDFILKGEQRLPRLKEKYDVTDIQRKDGKTKLRASLKDSDSFYDLINHLQKKDVKLEEVNNLDKNMEEIFMEVIEKEEAVR
ncbi:MAG: ABC transporter ATP-binding protein [Candidatus Thermoplasmatota archaeon]|nr:ABC transporter ATP-binding protein [Candidatus Thermoplasmatota archaeon]MBS3789914.1 ABC transporter ATP-binding protein [Candidatus Thermoplasmatota archaeon]